MASSKAITVSLLTVKVLRILLILISIGITIMVVVQLFNPLPFTVSFPVEFDVYDINPNEQINYSYSKIDIGPLKVRTGVCLLKIQ